MHRLFNVPVMSANGQTARAEAARRVANQFVNPLQERTIVHKIGLATNKHVINMQQNVTRSTFRSKFGDSGL